MRFVSQKTATILGVVFALGVSGAAIADADADVKRVGRARWVKEVAVKANVDVPANSAGVFFLRPQDDDGLQTSANVSINDRFQVSIQPGNFSQVLTCVGVNRIGAGITGHKSNDLLINAVDYTLKGGENYYFYVDVNDKGAATISRLGSEQATELMENMPRQNHQISRVVPDCAPAPDEKISIRLEVLFDTDKSIVKSHYFNEIERVSDYLNRFPDTVVTLEGHTDSRASDVYNQALSQRRVDAVKQVLVSQYGIAANRISTVGYGETRPIADNGTADGRQLNRRVMAVFETMLQSQ